jgi:hypothetical protein
MHRHQPKVPAIGFGGSTVGKEVEEDSISDPAEGSKEPLRAAVGGAGDCIYAMVVLFVGSAT